MHLDIYELVWLKLGMMIYTSEVYILILVYVTLAFIRDHVDAKKPSNS